MGWTWTNRPKGMTTRQFFEQEMGSDSQYEMLASAMTGSTFYAAMRDKKTGTVDAFVALTARSRSYHNFGYKDMDERMGPNEASAPAKVLDLLSPLPECDHEHTDERRYCGTQAAREWRAACRERLERIESSKSVAKGDELRFGREIEFNDGAKSDVFEWVGGDIFRIDGWGRYRLRGWREMAFTVLNAA